MWALFDDIMKIKIFLPIDINGIGLVDIIDDKTGELSFDSVIGDGNGDIDCSLSTLK